VALDNPKLIIIFFLNTIYLICYLILWLEKLHKKIKV